MNVGIAHRRRLNIVLAMVFVVFSLLASRLVFIQVVNHTSYEQVKIAQSSSYQDIPVWRGTVYDSTGTILAISSEVNSVYAIPDEMGDVGSSAERLARALSLDAGEVRKRLEKKIVREGREETVKFVWLKRRIDDREAKDIEQLKLAGVYLRKEHKRSYPNGDVACHALGITDIDDSGIEGIEKYANRVLAESSRRVAVNVDGRRNPVYAGDGTIGEIPVRMTGDDVHLTIDIRLQRIVEDALEEAMTKWRAKSIAAVAIDPWTGEILALANRPAFDPRSPGGALPELHRNRIISDPYEPGSTFKPFIMAASLEEGLCTPQTKIDCENGLWRNGSRILHDHHPYGILTLKDVIVKSSNIGAAKMGSDILGKDRMIRYLKMFGFGEKSGVDLPLEDAGMMRKADKWTYFTTTSVSFGHEILVTPLQLVTGFAAFANGGKLVRPYIISSITGEVGESIFDYKPKVVRRVIGEKTAETMKDILCDVVEKGTGTTAKIDGFKYCGKTGTTKKYDVALRTYSSGKYTSTFVAFAPLERPQICIAVVIDEPKGAYYAGTVAAPVVGAIFKKWFKEGAQTSSVTVLEKK